MSLQATINSQFVLCPPLDLPLRLNWGLGGFGAPRIHGTAPPGLCSDHFSSIHPAGISGLHQIHEAVDLASGAGSVVYATYSGQVMSIGTHDIVLSHQGIGRAYASQYIHVNPLPTVEVGRSVVKGEPIATVQDRSALPGGDHLHFELWHWVDDTPGPKLNSNAVPVDPTRLLYFWERSHRLDYATVAVFSALLALTLDAEAVSPPLVASFSSSGLAVPTNPSISALAPGCVWRISGDDDTSYLLRSERGAITVFSEAYGAQTIESVPVSRIGFQYRLGYPTFMVEADEVVYGIPLHGVANDSLLGQGVDEQALISLLEQAYQSNGVADLDIRRSPFWAMDGWTDEFAGVIDGVRLG